MKQYNLYNTIIISIIITIWMHTLSYAQDTQTYGNITSISDDQIVAQFENEDITVGDEIEIKRSKKIINPITQKIVGTRLLTIAKGVVEEIGLGKAQIKILEKFTREKITKTDMVFLTGTEKQINRPEDLKIEEVIDSTLVTADKAEEVIPIPEQNPPQYFDIQDIDEETDTIEMEGGYDDDISEGDIFLIQRKEQVFDPETKLAVDTKEFNVGKLQIESLTKNTSIGRIIEKSEGMELSINDQVVKEKEHIAYMEWLARIRADSSEIARLRDEVKVLKYQIRLIKATVDSLGYKHSEHLNEFVMLKNDIDSVLPKLMAGNITGARIRIKNDEPLTVSESHNLLVLYKKVLDDCFNKKFHTAIVEFQDIINRYPDSKLTENCRYWIAQSYFNVMDYPRAAEVFKTVISDRRFNHKDDDAAIMLGITYYRMNDFDAALLEFQNFINNYPDSEYKNKVSYWIQRLSS